MIEAITLGCVLLRQKQVDAVKTPPKLIPEKMLKPACHRFLLFTSFTA